MPSVWRMPWCFNIQHAIAVNEHYVVGENKKFRERYQTGIEKP
jgi:hypothetical protein